MRPRSRSRVRTTLAVAAVVLLHAIARAPLRARFGHGPVDGPDTGDAELVVLSWNLRNFPAPSHDRERIARRIEATAPHVLAVQEILAGTALAELVPARELVLSQRGGSHDQHLG